MIRYSRRRGLALLGLAVLLGGSLTEARAGGFFRKRRPAPTPTAYVAPAPPRQTLGTFEPTPYIVIRGNAPIGGGYSPLDMYGDVSMTMYGPLSAFRSTSAPVMTYARGYDGRTVLLEGTSFSTPNMPTLSPVIYPTRATYYYGFRESGDPPWWTSGTDWIDQN